MIEQKIKDNRRSVRYQKIKTRKHRAILGLKRCVDDDALRLTKDCGFGSVHRNNTDINSHRQCVWRGCSTRRPMSNFKGASGCSKNGGAAMI